MKQCLLPLSFGGSCLIMIAMWVLSNLSPITGDEMGYCILVIGFALLNALVGSIAAGISVNRSKWLFPLWIGLLSAIPLLRLMGSCSWLIALFIALLSLLTLFITHKIKTTRSTGGLHSP